MKVPNYFSILSLAVIGAFYGAPPAFAFGGVGGLGECATFATCTAGAHSGTSASVSYIYSRVSERYPLPAGMKLGDNPYHTFRSQTTTAPVSSVSGGFTGVPQVSIHWSQSSAVAHSQADFGINRASARTSPGASGTHTYPGASAHLDVQTYAQVRSVWRDVWTFSADGHLSAKVKLDGDSSTELKNLHFESEPFDYRAVTNQGEWFYELNVWDVTRMSPDADGFPGPTLVAHLQDSNSASSEQRPSFASTLPLEFDFMSGVPYVVTAQLGVTATNGRVIDLYNTAKLTDMVLSNDVKLSALSGHNYVSSPVPLPAAAWLFGSGLLGLIAIARRKARAA